MPDTEEAVSTLTELGLTEYEARCFVGLTRLTKGTAKEISQVADIPRSRVYDTVEELDRRGFVESQQSDPREYKAVPVEMAIRRLREDFDSRINAAENALQHVEEPESEDDEGMWEITHPDHVTDRICTFLDDAEETIHRIVTREDVLDRRIDAALQEASDRGVDVTVEVATADIRDHLADSVPGGDVTVSSDLATTNPVVESWPGQLVLVDKRAVVATGVSESDLPDVTEEVAVWTHGRDHGFAVWMRELLDDRLAELESAQQ